MTPDKGFDKSNPYSMKKYKANLDERTAFVSEIFSSVQGEGELVGLREIFIRLCGCNLSCQYCDTPQALKKSRSCLIEKTAGRRNFFRTANPLTTSEIYETVRNLNKFPHHSIALTGGEPLLQREFLEFLLPYLKSKRFLIHLETNGTLPEEIEKIIQWIDFVSMDFKLPSDTGERDFFKEHKMFIKKVGHCPLWIKIIISKKTEIGEFKKSVNLISKINPHIPLILQPKSPYGRIIQSFLSDRLLQWQGIALKSLNCVKVIPQIHKIMGVK